MVKAISYPLDLSHDELALVTPPDKLTIMVENLEESRK